MDILPFLLQLIGLACFFCSMCNFFPPRQIQLIAAGLFLWLLSLMCSGIVLHATR